MSYSTPAPYDPADQHGALAQRSTPAPTSGAATNTKAIVALPLAFSFSLLGLIFGILALREIGRTREGGKGFALTAVIIGALNLLLLLLFLGTFAAGMASMAQQMQGVSGL